MSEEEYEQLRDIHPELADVMRQAAEAQLSRMRDSFIEELREIEDRFFTERGDAEGEAEAWVISINEHETEVDHDAGTATGQLVFSPVENAPLDIYELLRSNDLFLSMLGEDVVGLLVRVGGTARGIDTKTGKEIEGKDVTITIMVNGSGMFTACRMIKDNEVHTECVLSEEIHKNLDEGKDLTGKGQLADVAVSAFMAPKQIRLTKPEIADAMTEILKERKKK